MDDSKTMNEKTTIQVGKATLKRINIIKVHAGLKSANAVVDRALDALEKT